MSKHWFNQSQVFPDLRSERCSRDFPDRQSGTAQEQLRAEGTTVSDWSSSSSTGTQNKHLVMEGDQRGVKIKKKARLKATKLVICVI